jgi:REase_MTES_1575/Protein of unknown function (DUF3320)
VSGYRIDLGIKHPDHPERFLAGIECDGARYHRSKSARDRDRLREEVLGNLGWDIVRVWSTDWFDNPGRETDKLVRKLEELRSKSRHAYADYPSLTMVLQSQKDTSVVEQKREQDQQAQQADMAEFVSVAQEASQIVSESTPVSRLSLLDSDEPLTKAQGIQVLVEFRESVIRAEMANWEPHRSILRDAMIEAFVSQHFTDPDEWFTKVPAFLRQGSNPVEKSKYLEQICEIVSRIGVTLPGGISRPAVDDFNLTSPEVRTPPEQQHLPLVGGTPKPSTQPLHEAVTRCRQYTATDFAAADLHPNAIHFYEDTYRPTLRRMVALVAETEGPIYEDILVDRIARAHGFQRSGSSIYEIVKAAIDRVFMRSKEDDRVVIWPKGLRADMPFSYRESSPGMRSHADIPIAELASLAAPFIRLRMSDEEVLRRMADHFQLGRIREATRCRFEEAMKLGRQFRP